MEGAPSAPLGPSTGRGDGFLNSALLLLGVISEALTGVPEWLSLGVGLGLALSLCAACLFYVGDRLYPSVQTGGPNLSGDARRVTEIRQYLDAIGERYAEDIPIEGHTVEFYLPERDVAITFDPRAFYAIERSATHAVLVEHEMPGMYLGSRLPFETPEVEFGTDEESTESADASVEGAYAVLGLPSNASDTEVRQAYREKVKEVHPDHGGSRDEFQQVQEAYAAASGRGEA